MGSLTLFRHEEPWTSVLSREVVPDIFLQRSWVRLPIDSARREKSRNKTDQVKVTRSLDRIARYHSPYGAFGMPATWVDRSLSRGDAVKCEDSQCFILLCSILF
jgi:hypothetical protein